MMGRCLKWAKAVIKIAICLIKAVCQTNGYGVYIGMVAIKKYITIKWQALPSIINT